MRRCFNRPVNRFGVALALALALAGCDDPAACIPPEPGVCIEYDADLDSARSACTSVLGEYQENTVCSRDGAVGGCRGSAGSVEETWWFYESEGIDVVGVTERCAALGYEFVSPDS